MILLTSPIQLKERSASREAERSALRLLLENYFGSPRTIAYRPSGQPYLLEEPDLHLSLSHTRGYVLAGLSSKPIGVDIECIDERVPRVTSRVLSQKARAYLEQTEDDRLRYLLYHLLWTAGEALYKLVEDSRLISDFAYDFSTLLYDNDYKHFSLLAYQRTKPEQRLRLRTYFTIERYVLSVAQYEGLEDIEPVVDIDMPLSTNHALGVEL